MRDFKFRVWDGSKMSSWIGLSDGELWTDCKHPIQQYTEIVDSKSTELYQGDVCLVDGLGNCEVDICKFYGAVFKKDGCEYPVIDSIAENDSFEVIGNIYENPELLESL